MKINVKLIKSFNPCQNGLVNFVKHHADFNGTELELLELDNIPVSDKLWLLLREDFIPSNDLNELACKFAESVLPLYEKQYPNDDRPRKAIEAKRKYLKGLISKDELAAARLATESAACSAAYSAACSAAYSAAWSAVRSAESAARSAAESAARSAADSAAWLAADSAESAAWSAAYSAAKSAEQQKQLDIVKTYFEKRK